MIMKTFPFFNIVSSHLNKKNAIQQNMHWCMIVLQWLLLCTATLIQLITSPNVPFTFLNGNIFAWNGNEAKKRHTKYV